MQETSTQVWNTCGYVRLSREDGDKEESNSVTGQKDLIRDYLLRHPELRECDMKVDDGFTGSNFQRPGFQAMMELVRAGKINCIVVKDLSRFGRDHLDAGEYIERIFPFLGVRFIAINDNYDSMNSHAESDEIIVPFKNLVNEAYCRDTSVKIRSQLEIKRQRGDFIGSFAVFGYKKDPGDRHRLVIDEFAADVVRDIFNWKLDGVSAIDIAARLTASGIPTPMDYKLSQGMRYTTAFRVKECHPHALRVEALDDIVLDALQGHIREVIDLSELMELTDIAKLQQANVQKIQARLAQKQEEIDRCQKLLRSLYENLADGIIDKSEYQELKSTYQDRRSQAEEQAEFLREEMGRELDNSANNHWIEQFIRHRNIVALDRRIVVTLIERVLIFRDRQVEIVYRWHNEFEWQAELVAQAQKLLPEKEAV